MQSFYFIKKKCDILQKQMPNQLLQLKGKNGWNKEFKKKENAGCRLKAANSIWT